MPTGSVAHDEPGAPSTPPPLVQAALELVASSATSVHAPAVQHVAWHADVSSWLGLVTYGHESHASPNVSLSELSWPEFGVMGQLSHTSATPSPS